MNVSLPEALEDFVGEPVGARGHGTSSGHVRERIRKDRDRRRFSGLLLEGAESRPAALVDADCFERLPGRVREAGRR